MIVRVRVACQTIDPQPDDGRALACGGRRATIDPNVVHAFTTSAALDCGDRNHPRKSVDGPAGVDKNVIPSVRVEIAKPLSSITKTTGSCRIERLHTKASRNSPCWLVPSSSSADDDKVSESGRRFDFGGRQHRPHAATRLPTGTGVLVDPAGAAANDVGQLATSAWGRGAGRGTPRETPPAAHRGESAAPYRDSGPQSSRPPSNADRGQRSGPCPTPGI